MTCPNLWHIDHNHYKTMHLEFLKFKLFTLFIFVVFLIEQETQSTEVRIEVIGEGASGSDELFYADDDSAYNDYSDYDVDNYNELIDVNNTNHRRLFKRDVNYDAPRYFQSCGKDFRVRPNQKIKLVSLFHGEKQYLPGTTCEWNFYSSPKCIPQITCETIDLRPSSDCEEEYLLILDGVGGWVRLCEEASAFTKPFKPSHGTYLFVIFKTRSSTTFTRLFKGIRCEVSCNSKISAERLPEKSGLFKIEEGCECGLKTPKAKAAGERITGGVETYPFEFPWMVGLVWENTRHIFCGGSLINSQFVLTATHCFVIKGARKINKTTTAHVIIHAHDLSQSDAGENTFRSSISRVICHPHYGGGAVFGNDYCVLKLATEINIMNHSPVCLPLPDVPRSNLDDKGVTVAGWGSLAEPPPKPKRATLTSFTLQKAEILVIPQNECIKDYGKDKLSERMICAGLDKGLRDSCQGDSGGPLIQTLYERGGVTKVEQVGVVSWGIGCGRLGQPGVYSYISAVVSWIQKTSMNGTWCKVGSRT